MNVVIRWHQYTVGDTDLNTPNRAKIYDMYEPQDYAISGPNQMWYQELYSLATKSHICSKIWINDEVVFSQDDGWVFDSNWYKDMVKFMDCDEQFNKLRRALDIGSRL